MLGIRAVAVGLFCGVAMSAAVYEVRNDTQDGIEVVRLTDTARQVTVSVAVGMGNRAYSMTVKGHEILWEPTRDLAKLKATFGFGGVPFLAPWANRIDGLAYYANDHKFTLNEALGNLRKDGNGYPIHGLLAFSPLWVVDSAKADAKSAHVTSKLEFWKYPDLMAQFPFAHTLTMTYRLHDGMLDVETKIENHSASPMPVAIGFHPYFQLDDAPRDSWMVHVAARKHVVLDSKLTPTGEMKAMDLPDPLPLAGHSLDDVFADLVRGEDGKSVFWVHGKMQKISVVYGPKYTVGVAYSPMRSSFICFEPMSALTNAFNLAHAGKYGELQSVAAGGVWEETFRVVAEGF